MIVTWVGLFMSDHLIVKLLISIVVIVQFTLAAMLVVMWIRAWMGL